jgi:hypothetical protein
VIRRWAWFVAGIALLLGGASNAAAQVPEVPELGWFDDDTLVWRPVGLGAVYNVYRGVQPDASDMGCLADDRRGITLDDPQIPPRIFLYLVSAETVEGEGPLGPPELGRSIDVECGDTDGDNVQDGVDNCDDTPNPDQSDFDQDFIGDACDECTDTDSDGFGNEGFPNNTCPVDNCPANPNPDQTDADGDGFGDPCDACTDTDGDEFGNPGFSNNTCPTDNCPDTSNPLQDDTDGDGFGDACDACTDFDGDGFGDPGYPSDTCPEDNCPDVPNPDQIDKDGDGIGDACEECTDTDGDGFGDPDAPGNTCPDDNCPATPNPDQTDSDGDGVGDLCEVCVDSDSDGYGDPDAPDNTCPDDNCPNTPNTGQEDLDADGSGDACDACTDTDADGFADPGFPASTCAVDNCPSTANPDQNDFDSDGAGDACDACTDTDGDGFGNPGFPNNTCGEDNCPDTPNAGQTDDDMDGAGDACDTCTDTDGDGFGNPGYPENTCDEDNCPGVSNPDQTDVDGDGVGDACEECVDSDGDGFGDPDVPENTCPDDNCPDTFNESQDDLDADGSGDACDTCTDTDGDGFGNPGFAANTCDEDNCPDDANPEQSDLDADGSGDVCDGCTDPDGDGLGNPGATTCAEDNCPDEANADQADQDADGRGDVCDASTYTFETDGIGARPKDVTQRGGIDETFVVDGYAGDRGVAYDGGVDGVHDVFDRLPSGSPKRDYTVYLDAQELANEAATIELWSDGTTIENAGAGVQLRLATDGTVGAAVRRGSEFEDLGSVSLASREELRVRLEKGLDATSTLFVDEPDGAGGWIEAASFPINDDSELVGFGLAVVNRDGGRLPVLTISGAGEVPAGEFSLRERFDQLASWKVFQRGPAGTAPVPVSFSYRASEPVTLEVAIVESDTGVPLAGFDFADQRFALDPAPDGADGLVDVLDVPEGGNYDVEAQLIRDSDGALLGSDVVASIGVGDVFLAAGQSNMSGYAGALEPAEAPVDEVHLFGNDWTWKRGAEPMDSSVGQRDEISVDTREEHSLMLRFAKDVQAEAGVPIAVIPAPKGGTTLFGDWARDPDVPTNRGTLYGSSLARVLDQGYAHPIRGVIWYQGESDVGRGLDRYLEDLERLVADYRADLGAPELFFGNCQLATRDEAFLPAWISIQEAQRQQADNDAGSVVIGTVDLTRSDNLHLDVAGYKEAGARLARAVLAESYGIAQPLGPQIVSIEFDSFQFTRIVVTYDKDVTGGEPGLYEVNSDGVGTIAVSQVTNNGNEVILDLAQPADGLFTTLTYGLADTPAANWVVAADGAGAALAFEEILVE